MGAADKVIELMKRQPRVEERGTLAPLQFAGKITLQVSGWVGAWVAGGGCWRLASASVCH